MNTSAGNAVFLSYASQDTEAALRLCSALREAGIEVWFDQNELVGGDAWDQKIRKQIKDCALFVPIISAATQARTEGYFRLEWRLADQRTHLMAKGRPFLLPVVIDDTRDAEAQVPDSFTEVQWTRLRPGSGGQALDEAGSAAFARRVKKLLVGPELEPGRPRPGERGEGAASPVPRPASRWWLGPVILGVVAVAVLALWQPWKMGDQSHPELKPASGATAPVSDARQLALRAQALVEALDGTRDDYRLAEELITQAKAKDATDAEVCAIEAHLHESFIQRGWDVSDTRRENARAAVQRANRLDARSFEARFVQARLLGLTGREGEERQRQLRELRRERPTDKRILRALATVTDRLGNLDESAAIARESAALPGGDPLALYNLSQGYWFAGRANDAEATIEASLAQKPFTGALLMSVWYKATLRGDIAQARQLLERIDPGQMQEDRAAYFAFFTEWLGRNPARAIAWLQAVPRDWLNDSWYRGPKGLLIGDAHRLAGRADAAAIEWQAALKLVEQRLADQPQDLPLLRVRVQLLAKLGRREDAERQFSLFLQIAGIDLDRLEPVPSAVIDCCIVLGRHADALRLIARFIRMSPQWSVEYSSALLRLDAIYDPLRAAPEFAALIAEVEAREKAMVAAARPGYSTMAPAQSAANVAPVAPGLSSAAAGSAADKSVAVLAFANLSEDKANEYFSDGISEELLNVLAKVPGLKVSARTSAFYFKGKEVPIPEIAKQLGVAYVVEGSVRKQGDRVRISVQLIKAADGFPVWSDTFTRDLKDIFAVQDEIAGLVAKNLELKLGAGRPAAQPVDPEAFRLVLEGRHYLALRSEANFAKGDAAFRAAVAIAPDLAVAYAGWAELAAQRGRYQQMAGLAAPGSQMEEVERHAARALQLDPSLAEPHAALAVALVDSGRLDEAEAAMERGIAANPNYGSQYLWRAHLHTARGRLDLGIADLQRATELDPLAFVHLYIRGAHLDYAGRWADALPLLDRGASLRGERFLPLEGERALARFFAGRRDEALALARKILADPELLSLGWWTIGEALWVLRMSGAEEEASRQGGAILDQIAPDNYLHGYVLCCLGRFEEGLPQLRDLPTIARNRFFYVPIFDPARETPAFRRLISDLKVEAEYAAARATLARLQSAPSR